MAKCSTCPEWIAGLTTNKGNRLGRCLLMKKPTYDNYGGYCHAHPSRPKEMRDAAIKRAGPRGDRGTHKMITEPGDA